MAAPIQRTIYRPNEGEPLDQIVELTADADTGSAFEEGYTLCVAFPGGSVVSLDDIRTYWFLRNYDAETRD